MCRRNAVFGRFFELVFGNDHIVQTFKFHEKVQKLDNKDVSISLFPKCQNASHIS